MFELVFLFQCRNGLLIDLSLEVLQSWFLKILCFYYLKLTLNKV